MSVKDDALRKVFMHKARVSTRMSDLANDLGARGRRHANSYTGDTELSLLMKIEESDSAEDVRRYHELLDEIHAKNNDYEPNFHKYIGEMNMIQLIEFIVDRVAVYDRLVVEDGYPNAFEGYVSNIMMDLPNISDDLRGVIRETILYVVDRNKSIAKNLAKEVKPEYEVIEDGSDEEE